MNDPVEDSATAERRSHLELASDAAERCLALTERLGALSTEPEPKS
jgi:hypothetical protein